MKRFAEDYIIQWFYRERRKPLVIRGARQVGKSTLVRRVAHTLGVPLWEVNLERYTTLGEIFTTNDVARILLEIGIVAGIQGVGSGKGILFLDEIQAVPQALTTLRYFYEDRPDIPVIAAGSLLELALKDFKTSMPVGRIEYFYLGPVLFSEYLAAEASTPVTDFFKTWNFGTPFSNAAHETMLDLVRDFIMVGGMPEASDAFIKRHDPHEVHAIHRSILETFNDDFGKYSTGAELSRLRRVFDFLPSATGEKFKYVRVHSEWRTADIKRAVEQLSLAGIFTAIKHSDASGIPLGAQASDTVWKPIFLDIGLAGTALGMPPMPQGAFRSARFVNEGPAAEQFIGQHLLYKNHEGERPSLYYWVREGKSTNAEVDYIVECGGTVIPVEVKSGSSGTMRSLHQFIALKNVPLALRFDLNPPSVQKISVAVMTSKGKQQVSYFLLSLPLYLVERAIAIAGSVMEKEMGSAQG